MAKKTTQDAFHKTFDSRKREIYAYYLGQSNPDCPLRARKKVLRFYNKLPSEALFFTEKAEGASDFRPLWRRILKCMAQKKVSTLIIPSLLHIADSDFQELTRFLNFAQKNDVRICSLFDGFDSESDPSHSSITPAMVA